MTLPSYNPLVASAMVLPATKIYNPKYDSWQDQAWDFYDRLGEFESGVSWLSNAMSRVRLLAAELSPGGDEPTPIEDGPVAEAVTRLAGGTGGQAELMKQATIHLAVPGEGWLVGEADPINGEIENWSIKSADELQLSRQRVNGQQTYEIKIGDDSKAWRPLSPDSLVVRFWDPHPRYSYRPDSAAQHARGVMTELDLISKRIVATLISRLASNGVLLYDKGKLSFGEATPAADGMEAKDPFADLLVNVAGESIKDPASAGASIPIPIGFNMGDLADVDPKTLIQHLTFADDVSDKLIHLYDRAVKKLATSLDIPADILLGLTDVTHWNAWQIEESGIKLHIAPKAELICNSLTTGYLMPTLQAMGEPLTGPNGGRYVIWYDPAELTVRPDRSEAVKNAYDRFEVSGATLRQEMGFSEDDQPDETELNAMVLKWQARQPSLSRSALRTLTGIDLGPDAETPPLDDEGPGGSDTASPPEDPTEQGERDPRDLPDQSDPAGNPPPSTLYVPQSFVRSAMNGRPR